MEKLNAGPLPITTTVEGIDLEGEIVALYTNDITVRLIAPTASPAAGRTKGAHTPHFMMAYRPNRIADGEGNLTERGQRRARELLAELYTEGLAQDKES